MVTYKTPDVYIKEISIFPPSVAEVETAIPAFIGYTEFASEIDTDDLLFVPTEIRSLLEYEELFGGAPPVDINKVVLDENNIMSSYEMNTSFYLYDSLRLFFANGGGKCYIISIGSYSSSLAKSHFEDGLAALKKKDEPTIILFPDAVKFQSDNLYTIQQAALKQCNDLQDRFCVFDMLEEKTTDPAFGWKEGYEEFRDKIGMNYLKYGSAYTPWLKTNLGIKISYRHIQDKVFRSGIKMSFSNLTNSSEVAKTLTNLENAISDVNKIASDLKTLMGTSASLKEAFNSKVDKFKANPVKANFEDLFKFIYDVLKLVDSWIASTTSLKGNSSASINDIVDDIKTIVTNSLKDSASSLISYDKGTSALGTAYNIYTGYSTIDSAEWGNIFDTAVPAEDISIYTGANAEEKRINAQPYISSVFLQVYAALIEIDKASQTYEKNFEQNLYESHTVYKNIIVNLGKALTTIPPSGAIAGIYAMVDSNRGVWKAPANVSLSNVKGLTETIDFFEQEELNVDVVAGKSINAIRAFTGKGIMVWGARTLAGNDNEWRYIPVRRFFNMVEESVKKSTYWAVFEPNDANTWIKVKAMIENYLTQKWRDGALAGAKPDEAFFVKVGLGLTMTQVDILEGRMNVEIGMAVVRPAEFIILKFSHKLQES